MNVDTFSKQLLEHLERIDAGKSLDGSTVAVLSRELTAREVEEGGPYLSAVPTTQVDANGVGKSELDVGFNLAILCVLRSLEVELPSLDAYVEAAVATGERSRVYDTTTFDLLLARYRRDADTAPAKNEATYNREEQEIMERIFKKLETRFTSFAPEVRERAKATVEKTLRGNPDKQMSLMAFYTRQALGGRKNTVSDDTIAEMGLANIFFWTAFIIYDDFWDEDEDADPQLLPIANLFARHYVDYFSNLLPPETGFRSWFNAIMDGLDGTNAWETEYCRARVEHGVFHIPEALPEYGDYEKKFYPAAGHIAGPVALLIQAGCALNHKDMRHFTNYAKHYLIAMQFNDDAHDWEEDMARGHLSTVVDLLLRDWQVAHSNRKSIDLEKDRPELQKLFWFFTMPKYASRALLHSRKAQTALEKMSLFEHKKPLMQFANETASIAEKAKQKHADVEKFIAHYQ